MAKGVSRGDAENAENAENFNGDEHGFKAKGIAFLRVVRATARRMLSGPS
jgi:hypothetical protein